MRRALAALLLAALVVAAAAEAATIRRSVPAAGMSLALPAAWKPVDAQTVASSAARALREENPQLAVILDQLSRPGSLVKLFAYDPAGAAAFATNVNVVVAPIPASATLGQYLAAARAEIAAIPGRVGAASTRLQRLPAARAVRSDVQVAITVRGRRIVTAITQWAFLRPGKSVVVSFTTTAGKRTAYRAAFAAAARSIRFR